MRLPTLFISLLLLLPLAACEESEPEFLVEEEAYMMMFAELAIIDQYDPNLLKNRSKEEVRDLVYQKYNVSKDDFRRSHDYYEEDIDAQLERLGKIILIMKEERDEVDILERELRRKNTLSADSLRQRLNIE